MAIYAKAAPASVPAPEGLHSAVCCDVQDLGLVETSYGTRSRCAWCSRLPTCIRRRVSG